jgi:hypothetical protein
MRITIAFVVTNLIAFGFGVMFGMAGAGLMARPVTAGAALLAGGTVGVVMMAIARIAAGEDEPSPLPLKVRVGNAQKETVRD